MTEAPPATGADGGRGEGSGGQQGLFPDVPVAAVAAPEEGDAKEERGTATAKKVAQKLATLVSEENARLFEKLAESLRETEERLAEAVRERAVEDGDAGLARRVAAAGREAEDAEAAAVAAVQAALPAPTAHAGPVFTVRQAFAALKGELAGLRDHLGLAPIVPGERFEPGRHHSVRARPTKEREKDRTVAAVVREGTETNRGGRRTVVEPALVEVYVFTEEVRHG